MSRSRPTQQRPGTYTHEQQQALGEAANRAAETHLFAAADFMSRLFEANRVPYAFMGGFALKLRGSSRDTKDVDIAVGCTMRLLIDVLSAQPRVRRPAGPMSHVVRIFVHIGGQFNPGVSELWVGVDIILRGSLGAPDNVQTSSERVPYSTNAGPGQALVIDILSAMASKLNAFYTRQEAKDHDDIWFLIRKYPNQVHAIRTQLNATHCQYFVASIANTYSQETIKSVKTIFGVA